MAVDESDLAQLRHQVRQLEDHRKISELVSGLGRWLDGRCLGDPAALFAADAVAVTPGGTDVGRDRVAEQARKHHADYHRLQHHATNVLIDQHADHASVQANLIALFVDGEPAAVRALVGRYRLETTRTAAGWRITRLEVHPSWLVGGPEVTMIPPPASGD